MIPNSEFRIPNSELAIAQLAVVARVVANP